MDEEAKRAIALWRLGVLGPLISARLEHGDRQAYFRQAASRLHERPDGKLVRLSARTIESWFYAYRQDGFDALMPDTRSDRGQSRSIDAGLADLIVRAKRAKTASQHSPHHSHAGACWSRASRRAEPLGRPRLLQAQGISGRPKRGPNAERRSFLVEHAGDLWVGDAMHGPLVLAGGALRKSYLLSQIDGATRYLPHSYFALSERAVAHEYGFKQALLKAGRPRGYYVDLGAAYRAGSLRLICAELGIRLLHTAPADCEAKVSSTVFIARGARRWATSSRARCSRWTSSTACIGRFWAPSITRASTTRRGAYRANIGSTKPAT